MQGAPRRSARSFFVLPLVLALLAFVALPNFASAAGEFPQYETENTETLPKVSGTPKESTTKPKHKTSESTGTSSEPKAHASENTTGGGTSPEEESESSEKEKSQTGGAAPNEGGGNGKPGGGETSKSGGSGGGSKDGLGGAKVAESSGGTATPVAHKTESSSGGGSSPVVPILIAVIVLAAISIGVVLYRQRKSGGQGPDRSVSSPNAS
jgi:cobalamin biosynthesis Mg chelatase CobN